MVQKPCAHIIHCWHSLVVTELSSWHWCCPGIRCSVPLRCPYQLRCFSCASAVWSSLWSPVWSRMFWWSGTSESMTCLGGCRAGGLVWGMELCPWQTYLSCLLGRTFKLNCAPWQVLFYRKRQFTPKESTSYNQYLVKVNDQGECILGGDIWQRKCVPQYSVEWKQTSISLRLGSTNVSRGSCWCHSYFALCKLKSSKQELKRGTSKWPQQKNPERQTQNFELITCCLQVFKRISNKNIFSSIFRTRPIKKKILRAVRKYSHEFKLPIQTFNL